MTDKEDSTEQYRKFRDMMLDESLNQYDGLDGVIKQVEKYMHENEMSAKLRSDLSRSLRRLKKPGSAQRRQ